MTGPFEQTSQHRGQTPTRWSQVRKRVALDCLQEQATPYRQVRGDPCRPLYNIPGTPEAALFSQLRIQASRLYIALSHYELAFLPDGPRHHVWDLHEILELLSRKPDAAQIALYRNGALVWLGQRPSWTADEWRHYLYDEP